ncbi:MAG: hypothetical protein WB762_21140 [Candidatus Sulfotelmatobacter sp.]
MTDEQQDCHSHYLVRGVVLASTAINSALEDMPTHAFSELPASVKENCETYQNGPAAYRGPKQQTGVTAGRNKLICRVCASLVVLVGKPCELSLC